MAYKREVIDGKTVYVNSYHGKSRTSRNVLLNIKGIEYIAGWSEYSQMWYIYRTEDGYEIASMRAPMFETVMRLFVVRSLRYTETNGTYSSTDTLA